MDNNFYNNFDGKPSNAGFYSRFLVPFISGGLGALLVASVFVGNYSVKYDANYNNKNSAVTTSAITSNSTSTAISLTNYSDTSIYAANKVLPSIVGIEVEYSVNSYFGQSRNKYCYRLTE